MKDDDSLPLPRRRYLTKEPGANYISIDVTLLQQS